MKRDIEFRAWDIEKKKYKYPKLWDNTMPSNWGKHYILEQYTGLKDKNGVKIFEGDIIRYKKPYRTTQTHTGDNMPNGSYTEPMEPSIKIIQSEVLFNDGMFTCEDGNVNFNTPISWVNNEWTLEDIKYAISWSGDSDEWFFDRDEGDLWYLIEEVAKVKDENELIKYLSGLEVIGNIHQNPELIL